MALGEETWRRETSWADTYNELKTYHDSAYRKIEEALRFDEEGQQTRALACYEEGLALIEKALSVNIECPSNPDFTWEKACSMVDKLRKTRKEALSRIADTQVQRPEVQQLSLRRPEDQFLEPPPSYEEAMASSPSSLMPSTTSSFPFSHRNAFSSGITPSSSGIASSCHGVASSYSGTTSGPSSVVSSSRSRPPQTYSELGEALQNLKIETKMQSAQIIFKVENVHIYFITPDGRVSAPSQPNLLRILELEDGQATELPKYFLQVGDWFYPLVPEVSPCYRSEYGAFILPDVNSDVEGAAVGLVLPAGAEASLQELLEDILQSVPAQDDAPMTRTIRDTFSNTVSKGIVSGAQYLSTSLIKGAERASQYINTTTPKIISHIQPEEAPKPVPDSVRNGVKVARSVTYTAANVSSYLGNEDKHSKRSRRHLKKLSKDFRKKMAITGEPVEVPNQETANGWHTLGHPRIRRKRDRGTATFAVKRSGKVGSATMALGHYLAPHVKRGGTTLLTKVGVGEEAAAEGVGGALTVAAGAVEGLGTIYSGLENAAAILGSSLTNNTVQIVHHKYGEPMATVAGNTLSTVGNVLSTTNNIQNLTPKSLAKRTAKNTGKALVEPHFNQPSTSKKK